MTQHPTFDRPGDAPASTMAPARHDDPASLLASFATRLVSWRRRARQARDFRGFDKHQLRDLGINHFDQW